MSWDRYSSDMERYVIKTDVIASSDEYFMATHMPFSNLEVIAGGRQTDASTVMSEEDIYQKFIYNPDDIHRVIIVRGNNGTGKSHLIRWLRTRYENDFTRYNPEKEKIIFLRRLNNTIKGAIAQILDEKIISDTNMVAKLQKFVLSTDAQDPDTFKTSIYHAFINLVANDKSGDVYKPFICKGIQEFLYDSRVRAHLMRQDGAINRCYKAITAPSDSVFDGEAAFNADDFSLQRSIFRDIQKNGSQEAGDFAEQLYDTTPEIDKLVKYLNSFTPKVIQSCADISSESTKDIFIQLRKSIKSEGKGLTIFIEDFTAFTGIDSELITVLSAEHGGENSDLCRVTAVIGITDAYYGQFKDNFTDRVQHQINVTESSYNGADFLESLASRYLNAIYCGHDVISRWFSSGADISRLPVADIKTAYPWPSVAINNHEFTLYPFTPNALTTLFSSLRTKTPRRFLNDVLKSQLKEFFDGMQYGDSKFPTYEFIDDVAAQAVQMQPIQASAIDKDSSLSDADKSRLKLLLAVWGDKTAQESSVNGTDYLGNVPKAFLGDIGLSAAKGITPVNSSAVGQPQPGLAQVKPQLEQAAVVPEKTRRYNARKRDITAWCFDKKELQYSADFRKWVLDFVRDAIDWQAEGIPAYIASERLREQANVYIEGQKESAPKDKALISLDRTSEIGDILHALCDYDFYGGWLFNGAAYYQQKLVNWLESNKADIKARVCDCDDASNLWPVIKWGMATQYIVAKILGVSLDESSPEQLAKCLFNQLPLVPAFAHNNPKWQDVVQYIHINSARFNAVFTLYYESAKTYMGSISTYRASPVLFFRSLEVINAVKELQAAQWELGDSLPAETKNKFILRPADALKELYPRIDVIVATELEYADMCVSKLENILGEPVTKEAIVDVLASVADLFTCFNANRIQYAAGLKAKFDVPPIERAEKVMAACNVIERARSSKNRIGQLDLLSANPIEALADLHRDLVEIERIAMLEHQTASKGIVAISGDHELSELMSKSVEYFAKLADRVDGLEVYAHA